MKPTPSSAELYDGPAETYGVHILKACMIFFQILVHSHIWAVQSHLVPLAPIGSPLWSRVVMAFGSLALVVPMSAGAVLRMVCKTDDAGRVTNIDWTSVIGTMLLLALFESTKEALAYEASAFFLWNVLHLVAVTFLLTLFLAQYGMALLWSVALTIFFLTPPVIAWLDPWEYSLTRVLDAPNWPLQGLLFTLILSAVVIVAALKLVRSTAFRPQYKRRLAILMLAAALPLGWYFMTMRNGVFITEGIRTLPIGMLAGTRHGIHIWGFFPWAGNIMIGFLVYDLIVRTKAAPKVMIALFAAGICLLAIFFTFFSADALDQMSKTTVLSGLYMNRTPSIPIFLVNGLFCVAAPIAHLLKRRGFERGYVIDLSRSILWVYIYQTSVLVWLPRYFTGWLPQDEGFIAFAVFALLSSLALPILLRHAPTRIHLQLRKQAAEI